MDNVIHGHEQAALNLCGCNRLHFTYGPITLHFDRDEFLKFAKTVSLLAAQVPYVEDIADPVTIALAKANAICH